MKNQRILISTSNYKNRFSNNLNDILCEGLDDFKYFEIASGHYTDEKTFTIIKNMIKNGKEFLFHNYPFREKDNLLINLCENEPYKKNKIISYIKEMIILTKEIGENYFSFHGGFYSNKLSLDSQKEINYVFKENLIELIEFAELQKVYLGIENHVVEYQNIDKLYLYNKEQFEELFNEINSPYLMLHLDMGHLKISAKTYGFKEKDFIDKFANRIMTVHLHENDGIIDYHNNFNDDAYFLSYLNKMNNLKNIVIETWNKDDRHIKEMVRMVENAIKNY